MSGETFLIGSILFKPDIDGTQKQELLAKLKDLCEDEFKLQDTGDYHIESINWSSHVDADEITNFFEEHGQNFKEYHLDLYYLAEADERWNSDP